jgi:Flp pilus assembly protein TadD
LTKWYFDEALSYESIGQVDQAAAMYREATRSDGDTRRSWYNLGLLESTRGRHQVAIEAFRRAIRAGMKGGRVWNDLGVALLRSGRATEARDALAEAVRLRPDRTDWRHNYAAALMASGGEDNRPLSTPSTTINPRRPVVDWR